MLSFRSILVAAAAFATIVSAVPTPEIGSGLVQRTVPFNSVRQSRVTGPSKSPKCHVGHGNFYKVPKSFCDLALKYRIFWPPAAQNCGKSTNVTVSLGGCRNQNFV